MIILQEDVEKLGHRGDVVHREARLRPAISCCPTKSASKLTVGKPEGAGAHSRLAGQEDRPRNSGPPKKTAELLHGVAIKFHRKTGETTRLFGSVHTG